MRTTKQVAMRTTKQVAKTDVIHLLEKDHRKVERLVERYRDQTDPRSKRNILEQVTTELSRHMAAEEKELYPIVRDKISGGKSLIRDASHEHREARGLLAELAASADGTFDMDAKVATLGQAIAHHVRDEEGNMFPKIRESLAPTLIATIGVRIVKAKAASATAPARSATRHSPGTTVRGMLSAAANRVTDLLTPKPRAHASGKGKSARAKAQHGLRRAAAGDPRKRARK